MSAVAAYRGLCKKILIGIAAAVNPLITLLRSGSETSPRDRKNPRASLHSIRCDAHRIAAGVNHRNILRACTPRRAIRGDALRYYKRNSLPIGR